MTRTNRLSLETLEARLMLTTMQDAAGWVNITGNARNDSAHVYINRNGRLAVNENGTVRTFTASTVTGINFVGGHGDDAFINDTAFQSYASGGLGNDYLKGGRGDDTLIGGLGNDILIGGRGLNHLYGQAGDDTVYFTTGDYYTLGGQPRDAAYLLTY